MPSRHAATLAATHGLLVGGSTGSVLAAVRRHATQIPQGSTVIAISPDLGDRYVDMIYDDRWVQKSYGQPPGDYRCNAIGSACAASSAG
jgi:hypothetical protein